MGTQEDDREGARELFDYKNLLGRPFLFAPKFEGQLNHLCYDQTLRKTRICSTISFAMFKLCKEGKKHKC